MAEKYIMFSLEDEKSRKLGEVISNPTCKKIVNFLSENEASASDISKELKIPMNTLDYNLKKLVQASLIEKTKHFWSKKGKKIHIYKVANKLIVIQPKKSANVYSKLKNIMPMTAILAFFTLIIGLIEKTSLFSSSTADLKMTAGEEALRESIAPATNVYAFAPSSFNLIAFFSNNLWLLFTIAIVLAMGVYLIVNWKKL
jgi:predicted transcriptional regulator